MSNNTKRTFDYDIEEPSRVDEEQIPSFLNHPFAKNIAKNDSDEEQLSHEAFVERLRHASKTDHEINTLTEYGQWSNIRSGPDIERMQKSPLMNRLITYLLSYKNVPDKAKKSIAPLDILTEMYYTGTVICYLNHYLQSSEGICILIVEVLNERLQDSENCITTCLVFAADHLQMESYKQAHLREDELVPLMNQGQEDVNMSITENNLEDHLKSLNTRKTNIQQLSVPMRFINHFFDFYPVSLRAQSRSIPL
jgi:hypothetical protein